MAFDPAPTARVSTWARMQRPRRRRRRFCLKRHQTDDWLRVRRRGLEKQLAPILRPQHLAFWSQSPPLEEDRPWTRSRSKGFPLTIPRRNAAAPPRLPTRKQGKAADDGHGPAHEQANAEAQSTGHFILRRPCLVQITQQCRCQDQRMLEPRSWDPGAFLSAPLAAYPQALSTLRQPIAKGPGDSATGPWLETGALM